MSGFYPHRTLTAVLELHTFSSLNKDFLPTYNQAMESADEAVVFYDPGFLRTKNCRHSICNLSRMRLGVTQTFGSSCF